MNPGHYNFVTMFDESNDVQLRTAMVYDVYQRSTMKLRCSATVSDEE